MFDLFLSRLAYLHLMTSEQLTVLRDGDVWQLSGPAVERFVLVNEFLSHLADRNYSPRNLRAYAFDLMAFGRWLETEGLVLAEVDTDVLLRFLTACREAVLPGRPGGNVYSIKDGRNTGYAPSTINRRLAAISALFAFRQMRDPSVRNPPRGRQARGLSRGERSGLLAHFAKPAPRSRLRLREPQRLPRGLSREESTLLLGSFRTWRDRVVIELKQSARSTRKRRSIFERLCVLRRWPGASAAELRARLCTARCRSEMPSCGRDST